MGQEEEKGRNGSEVQGTERELRAFLDAHRGERHIIVLQNFPDPDAISSAFAYQEIAKEWNIQADMIYTGRISHQQNVALVKLVGINLMPYNNTMDLSPYEGSIYVDNQGTTSEQIVQALELAGVPPLLIVDHHEMQDRLRPELSIVRRIGATASIFAQYIEQGLLEMNKQNRDHTRLSTSLLHGIMTDTGNFIHATDDDFCAASYLSHFRDAELLLQIVSQSRSRKLMDIIHQALETRVIVENFSIAGVGYLRSEARDIIPQAADFLLTEENIHTVIVFGIVIIDDQEERVIGSMRTTKITIDPDDFLKDLFGRDTRGNYFGGGKVSAGGFEIPVGFLSGGTHDSYRELKWQVYDNQIKQKIFKKIGVEIQKK